MSTPQISLDPKALSDKLVGYRTRLAKLDRQLVELNARRQHLAADRDKIMVELKEKFGIEDQSSLDEEVQKRAERSAELVARAKEIFSKLGDL